MNRIFEIVFVFAILFSSCSNQLSSRELEKTSPNPYTLENQIELNEKGNSWNELIPKNRDRVLKMVEKNPDALSVILKPAERESVPTKPLDDIPNCVVEWAYHYFNHRVTYEFPEYFSGYGEIERVLRVLTGIRRVESKPVDTFMLAVHTNQSSISCSDNWISISVSFLCHYQIYDDEKQEYVTTETDNIRVNFSLIKENGAWIIEDADIMGGEYYDYAVICMYKTMGRFPDVSEYEIADYTIYEYAEKLYPFGTPSPIP